MRGVIRVVGEVSAPVGSFSSVVSFLLVAMSRLQLWLSVSVSSRVIVA